jgi:hypothetical protein
VKKHMTQPTPENQVENLRMAYAIMAGIPAERVSLPDVRATEPWGAEPGITDRRLKQSCGSVACVAGWLSAHPYFKRQGLRYEVEPGEGGFIRIRRPRAGEVASGLDEAADYLFGDGSYYLFGTGSFGLEGKRQALRRIRDALYSRGAISYERNNELQQQEEAMTA